MKKLAMLFSVGLVLGISAPTNAKSMACSDDSGLCLDPLKGAAWQAGRKATRKQRKKRSSKRGGTVSMTIENGRGSLFINGRYAGSSPLKGAEIPRGRNDIQVRDGAEILAEGLLTVPTGGDVTITVVGHG